jgi:hypothetical protein
MLDPSPRWISIRIMTQYQIFLMPRFRCFKPFQRLGWHGQARRTGGRAIASALGLGLALSAPALAQEATFGTLTVAGSGRQTIQGQTGGTTSLPSAVAGQARDPLGHDCLGYGALTPNHILQLASGRDRLVLTVDSGGQDTTLIVKGPGGQVWCGDDISGRNLDAQIAASGWQPGTYEVWVGTFDAGQRYNYTLILD